MDHVQVFDVCTKEVITFQHLSAKQALTACFEQRVLKNKNPSTYKSPSDYGIHQFKNGDLQLWRFLVKADSKKTAISSASCEDDTEPVPQEKDVA